MDEATEKRTISLFITIIIVVLTLSSAVLQLHNRLGYVLFGLVIGFLLWSDKKHNRVREPSLTSILLIGYLALGIVLDLAEHYFTSKEQPFSVLNISVNVIPVGLFILIIWWMKRRKPTVEKPTI